jgi:hypothetical protein
MHYLQTRFVISMPSGMFEGLGIAPVFPPFSAMVHIFSRDRHKLCLRLGIGDGAFPKSAKMRQKAPFSMAEKPYSRSLMRPCVFATRHVCYPGIETSQQSISCNPFQQKELRRNPRRNSFAAPKDIRQKRQ